MICYSDILFESTVDGLGLRVVVFLQGCVRHCPGCHNPDLIPTTGGTTVSVGKLAELVLSKLTPLHRGVTFSGGEPLLQADELLDVIAYIKSKRPKTDIWIYTGYSYEEVRQLPLMGLIDVLIDGPFIIGQRDISLAFRGSANQRIIDMRQTRASGKLTELHLDRVSAAG